MILITGASGFVGRNLLRHIDAKKMRIRCLVRNKNKLGGDEEAEIIEGDISDRNVLNEATKNVDTVVHLAAVIKSSVPREFVDVNVTGTKNLVEACLRNEIKKIIYVSSLDAALNKHDLYGETKAGGEDEIIRSGIDYIILRPALIYGTDLNGINVLAKIVKTFPIIPVIGGGTHKLQPVYINDVCEIIAKLINSDIRNKIYYIAGEQDISMNALIDKIADIYGKKVFKIHIPLWSLWLPLKIYNLVFSNYAISYQALKLLDQDKICKLGEIKKDFNF